MSSSENLWVVYSDGASRGNPGLAAAGVYIEAPDGKAIKHKKFLGTLTNNQSEYEACILGLEALIDLQAQDILVRADSELMIKQLKGEYRVKNEKIKPLFARIQSLLTKFSSVSFEHVRRELNKEADRLANQAIDEQV